MFGRWLNWFVLLILIQQLDVYLYCVLLIRAEVLRSVLIMLCFSNWSFFVILLAVGLRAQSNLVENIKLQ